MTKMEYEGYELIKLKNIGDKFVGLSLCHFGTMRILNSFSCKEIKLVVFLLLGIIIDYFGISLIYKKVFLSVNQIKIIGFLQKTKIYNITDLSMKHEATVSSDRDIISEDIIYNGNKRILRIESTKRNEMFINKLWQRGIKNR